MIVELIQVTFPLIFTSNLVMAAVKYLADKSMSRVWLRTILGIMSIMGVIASASLTGDAIDFDSLTELGKTIATAAVVAIGSHFSYKVIKLSPSAR